MNDMPRDVRYPRWATFAVVSLCSIAANLGCGGQQTEAELVEPTGGANKTSAEATRPEPPPLERAMSLLKAAGLMRSYSIDATAVAKAQEVGLSEDVVVGLIEDLVDDCFATDEECEEFHLLSKAHNEDRQKALRALIGLLGETGSPSSLPLLLRLDGHGDYRAAMARERQMTERMLKSVKAYPCAPPSDEEIASARAELQDFVALGVRRSKLTARRPSQTELDDLAYFLAAVRDSGGAVGQGSEEGDGSWIQPGPVNMSRAQLLEEIEAAKREGRIDVVATRAREYLQTLGYPGPLQTDEAHEYAWGGARFSYVMRDLAEALEVLGQLDEAAHLYRRANPGGGACGTSVSARWQAQVRGVIRCEERRKRCGAVVPERLLDLGGLPMGAYGVARIDDAGFDVARLYRGALVTVNRDVEPDQLEAALNRAPGAFRKNALKRLVERGPEAWEKRVYAIEGLADVAGREAIPTLMSLTKNGGSTARVRAVKAIGAIGAAPPFNPCSTLGSFGFGMSSAWEREVRSLGHDCATVLLRDEAEALTRKLVPLARDDDPGVREEVARALGKIGSPVAIPHLTKLLEDTYRPESIHTCESGPNGKLINCRSPFLVREAAQEGLDHIEELQKAGVPPLDRTRSEDLEE